MARALRLAEQGLTTTTPNPRVGCVIAHGDTLVGEGWHERAGQAHAEVIALRQAGIQARGATAYVTLEPCSHHGRTPPCADALIAAGIGRVVAAMRDPNPDVAGEGLQRLAEAGIEIAEGLMSAEAEALNTGFISRMTRGRPWVRLKVATTLDGKTALNNGVSQWITGPAARADGHAWRARACAVLTGYGTIREDDPQLTVRDAPCSRQPLKVVVDARLETPLDARLLDGLPVLIAAAVGNPERIAALRARNAEVVILPNAAGKVDLEALFTELARRGINEVHVEAGFKLNGSLLREGCVDELLIYQAPMLVGDAAQGAFNLAEMSSLAHARRLDIFDVRQVGADLRLRARFRPDQGR
ncbi:bifunctional diaminohydroxyphosphoribosylaminopyrimidine deaminase/5-amino-6-(5-phosphoribosylamino)uracil reductase RibD [Nitrogeniibacter mangrovi]|uniref:Riboflavin biosynthesis protein RibD n=1 Tax=Nitrogeniibacter mangrovi TaxID=2016596 RepID=A0A6C1B7V3_9RHOO|nr:bifunctional diaminohydroxyphosphoribosylaminopyrimidine deaminase/5-amino-6-(5-phosphoribosylamino)uracil reductase RibD [Nitrogeniibacter mangrovi]QID19846.1 bifunctional diaminohydroxyphosphoribosylaminopyrimidine deaminase/5-amino-6-(5-phosphoribosylamino)uracil reductase RibD [Nitrogeniibacter mangrovi]